MKINTIFLISLVTLLACACHSSNNSESTNNSGDSDEPAANKPSPEALDNNLLAFQNLCIQSSDDAERFIFRRLLNDNESCEEMSRRVFELATIDLSYSGSSHLSLTDTAQTIKTVTPLKHLVNAKTMLLQGNDIEDLTPLYDLKSLTELNISHNPVTSIPEIASLEVLDISGTKISSIRNAEKVKTLREIYVAELKIEQDEIDALDQVSVLKEHCARLDIHYNAQGFDQSGMHRNKTPYDNDGFDHKGYNEAGFDRSGINKLTGTEFGLDEKTQSGSYFDSTHRTYAGDHYHNGYDYQGYDLGGFDQSGIHRDTGTCYHNGYDYQGYDDRGFNRSRIHRDSGTLYHNGYDYQGYNYSGFNASGIHRDTGTEFNSYHMTQDLLYFDSSHRTYTGDRYRNGYDYQGYDNHGFNRSRIHRDTGTRYHNGYDYQGYDQNGFNAAGTHRSTRNEFGLNGLTQSGSHFGSDHRTYTGSLYHNGYDYQGYNRQGFNASGIHRDTGTRNAPGQQPQTGANTQVNHTGVGVQNYDENGFRPDGTHRNGTRYNQDGFTRDVYQRKMTSGGVYCSVPQNIRTTLVPATMTNQDLDQIIKRCKELSPLSYQNYDEESQRFTTLRRAFNLSHYNQNIYLYMNRNNQDYLSVYIRDMANNRGISSVNFIGEPGIDAGGVYRDFFGHLASRFVHTAMSNLDENHYFFKRNDGAAFDVINTSAAADQLGGSERNIGKAIASIVKHEIRGSDRNSAFSYPTVNLRLPVLYRLKILGRTVTDIDIKAAWLMEDDESKNTFKNMVQYFDDSRDYATDPLDQLEDFTNGFHQLISANSMTMQHMTVDDLSLIITGPQMVTNQILKDRLSVSSFHPRATQARTFWNRYVDEELTTTEKKQRILQVITGGPFLPQTIRFDIVNSANIAAHTCFNSIDIPETTLEDYDVFKGALESLYDLIGFNAG